MPEIGKRIKARREELGMTQEELAARLGYKSKTTIATAYKSNFVSFNIFIRVLFSPPL